MTKQELLDSIREYVEEIDATVAQTRNDATVLDVREKPEFEAGHIPGATHLSRSYIEIKIEKMLPNREAPIVTYCGGGTRSLLAADTLKRMGYTNVVSMKGGFRGWKEQGFDIAQPTGLSAEQRKRYARHVALPEVGEDGQQKLLDAKVLIVGAGGLGSPAALYLAAAGIGHLGIVDFDVVETSNLQRQVLHNSSNVGIAKTESAKATLLSINPTIQIDTYNTKLTTDNVAQIVKGYDVVVDGCDNFATRYALSDYCFLNQIPLVHGSVERFKGQLSVFKAGDSGCYRCLYAAAPPSDEAPSCAEAGVLGVVPGVIGSMQATEVLKIVLGLGDVAYGKLICYDAAKSKLTSLTYQRDGDCKVCHAAIR